MRKNKIVEVFFLINSDNHFKAGEVIGGMAVESFRRFHGIYMSQSNVIDRTVVTARSLASSDDLSNTIKKKIQGSWRGVTVGVVEGFLSSMGSLQSDVTKCGVAVSSGEEMFASLFKEMMTSDKPSLRKTAQHLISSSVSLITYTIPMCVGAMPFDKVRELNRVGNKIVKHMPYFERDTAIRPYTAFFWLAEELSFMEAGIVHRDEIKMWIIEKVIAPLVASDYEQAGHNIGEASYSVIKKAISELDQLTELDGHHSSNSSDQHGHLWSRNNKKAMRKERIENTMSFLYHLTMGFDKGFLISLGAQEYDVELCLKAVQGEYRMLMKEMPAVLTGDLPSHEMFNNLFSGHVRSRCFGLSQGDVSDVDVKDIHPVIPFAKGVRVVMVMKAIVQAIREKQEAEHPSEVVGPMEVLIGELMRDPDASADFIHSIRDSLISGDIEMMGELAGKALVRLIGRVADDLQSEDASQKGMALFRKNIVPSDAEMTEFESAWNKGHFRFPAEMEVPKMDIVKLVTSYTEGFLSGFLTEGDSKGDTDLPQCNAQLESLMASAVKVAQMWEKGANKDTMKEGLKELAGEATGCVVMCKSVVMEMLGIVTPVLSFKDPRDLARHIEVNVIKNSERLSMEGSRALKCTRQGDFYCAGQENGMMIEQILVGQHKSPKGGYIDI
eukprot:GHVN01089413.1.p1 GENE.GHVN01089413.1~~GHVN01089413.1.p1  ORF type:complete len:668 (-),score=136.39 GHVN01089413.1:169-2172(-)